MKTMKKQAKTRLNKSYCRDFTLKTWSVFKEIWVTARPVISAH